MTPCPSRALLRAGLLLVATSALATAGGDGPAPAPGGAAARPAAAATEEIRWARSWVEATEEAAERNVAIYLHSHGST